MIKSMTGYGRSVMTLDGREFTVELRSVNNRYLDCSVRLPRLVSFAEDAVKQAVKASVSRGKVDVFITVRSEAGDEVQVTLNKGVLEAYLTAMREMVTTYDVRDDISVATVSRMPEVFSIEKPQVDEEQLKADMMSVLTKALENYDAMRCTEGAALDADLRSRGKTIEQLVSVVEAGNGQTVADYRTRLENKLREVLENTNIDESRILTEAAIFADKVAVDEETVRLRSHLQQMNTMLSGGGAVYHDLGNLNFTFIADAAQTDGLDMQLFCQPVVRTLQAMGVDARVNGRNDMTIDGKKFSGNAQYVRNGRIMHHGTILFDSDMSVLAGALRVDPAKIQAKGIKSVRSRVTNVRPYLPEDLTLAQFRAFLLESILEEFLPEGKRYKNLVNPDSSVMTPQEATEFVSDKLALAAKRAWENRAEALYANEFGRAPVGMCRRVSYDDGSGQMWGDVNTANFVALEGGNDSGIELLYVFDEAENRMHTIKAVMYELMK